MSAEPETAERLSLDSPVALLRKMNHDIRNPLNAGQDRAVKRIERNAQRILVLLDDLIGYAKVEGGELQPIVTDFDPRKLIEGIQAECQPVAAAKQLTISAS